MCSTAALCGDNDASRPSPHDVARNGQGNRLNLVVLCCLASCVLRADTVKPRWSDGLRTKPYDNSVPDEGAPLPNTGSRRFQP